MIQMLLMTMFKQMRPFHTLPIRRLLSQQVSNTQNNNMDNHSTTRLEDDEPALQVTDRCATRIASVADEGEFLRIEVTGGGCSGFQYKFDVDTVISEDDVIVNKNGSRVVVDQTSLNLIRGAVIDYKEELIRNSFYVSQNPKAEKGCSCGASFTLKIDS